MKLIGKIIYFLSRNTAAFVEEYLEMYSDLTILTPRKYFQRLFDELTQNRRAEFVSADDIGDERQLLKFVLPNAETIRDLHGTVKSLTSGFGSYEMEDRDWRPVDLVVLIRAIKSIFCAK